MSFNHYAKIKRILSEFDEWYVVRIDQPTSARTFSGETRHFEYYYRVYSAEGNPIKYCKFQQLSLFARTMNIPEENIPVRYQSTKVWIKADRILLVEISLSPGNGVCFCPAWSLGIRRAGFELITELHMKESPFRTVPSVLYLLITIGTFVWLKG